MSIKYIDGYGDLYMISELGRIQSFQSYNNAKPHELHPSLNKKRGYLYVSLINPNKKRKNWALHRLMAETFLDNPDNLPCVNHKDGNKMNNCIDNLEWCTYQHNSDHARSLGLTKVMKKNEGPIKYSNEQCRDILDLVRTGMTYKNAGKKYNMPYSTVAHLVRGSRRSIA